MSSRRSAKSHDDGGESSSVNGTGENTEEEIEISEDEESERSSDDKKKKRPAKACSYNKSAFSMPDDIKKLMERVLCCSCGKQLNPMNKGAIRRHPWLKVVTCKKCYKFLKSGPFTRDKDGTDEQCRWCGDGGQLYGCDFCNNCFCRSCVKRNLGRSEAAAMENEDNLDSKWKCYVCKPKKICKLVGDCSKIIEYVEKEEQKEKEREERAKLREKEKQKAKEKQREEKHKEHTRNCLKNENEEKVKIEKGIKFEDADDSSNPRRSLPAPKDKGKIVEGLKTERKEHSSEMKGKSEVIVVDDSIQHKSTMNKVDATKVIHKVLKFGTGVNDMVANSKSTNLPSQQRVEKFIGQIHKSLPVGMVNHSLATNAICKNVNSGIRKELLPPNDMSSLKDAVSVVNVEYILNQMQKVAQSLNLMISSVSTDFAIAKLTSANTFQAKTVAVGQFRSGMDVFFKSLSDTFSVQLVSHGHESFSVGKANDSNTFVVKPSLTKSEHRNDKDDVIEIQDSDIFIVNGESVDDVIEVDMITETPVKDNEQFSKLANAKNKINKPIFVDDSVDTAIDNEYVSLSEDDTETVSNVASTSDCMKENVEKIKDTVNDSDTEFILKESLIKIKEVITEKCNNAESTISPGKSHMENNCEGDKEYDSNDVENKSKDVDDENDIDMNNSGESLPHQMESDENIMLDAVDFKKSSTKSVKEDKFKTSVTIEELDAGPNQSCGLRKDQHDEDSEDKSNGDHSKKSGKKSQKEHIAKTDEELEVSDKIDSKKYDKASRKKNKSASHIGETSANVDTAVGGKKSFKDASNNDRDEIEGDIDLTKSQKSVKEKNKNDVRENTTCNADEDSEAKSDNNDTKISAKKASKDNKSIGDLEMLDNDDSMKLSSMSQNKDNDKRKKSDVEDDSEGISVSKDSKKSHKGKKHRESKDMLDNVDDNTSSKNSKKEDTCSKSGDNTEEYSEGISDSDGTRSSVTSIPNENESKDVKKVIHCADMQKSSKRNQHEDKVSKICDSAEKLESSQDQVNESLNIAAELKLLKNMADEINESERNASVESQESRRSTRNRGNKEIDTESDNINETLKRSSRTASQKSKQTEDHSDDENDEASSVSHGKGEKDKSKKSNKEKEKNKDGKKAIKNAKGEQEAPGIAVDSSSGSESDDSDSSVSEMEFGHRKKRRSARHAKVEASPIRKTRSQKQDTSRSLRSASSKNSKSLSNNERKQKLESDSDADVGKRAKNRSKESSQSKQKTKDDHKSSKAQKNKAEKKDSKIKQSSDSDTDVDAETERPTKSQSKSKQKGKDDTDTSKTQKQKDETEDKKYFDSDTDVDADVGKQTKSQSKSKKKGKDDPDSEALKNKDKAEEKLFSDSDTDFDADLEKQIQSLSKDIKLSKKKVKENPETKNSKKHRDKAENKKSKENKSPKGKKIILDSDDDDNDDDENEDNDDMQNSDENDENNDSSVEKELSQSQIEALKQAEKVARDDSNIDDEDDDDIKLEESDDESSDSEVTFPKLATSEKGKKKKLKDKEDKSEDSDFVTPKKKPRLRTKLLNEKLTDNEEEDGKGKKKGRKRKKRDTEEEDDSEQSEDGKKGKRKKQRRIKKVFSSDENEKEPGADDDVGTEEEDDDGTPGGYLKRRKIRKVQGTKKLAEETKAAQKAEEERRQRIADRQKEYNSYVEVQGGEDEVEKLPDGTEQELVKSIPATDSIAEILGSPRKIPVTTKCILDMDKDKKPLIEVDRTLIRKLKPHQVEAVRFIYNCCIESVERMKEDEGAGCILAHCMGLGKTLSVITFIHTMLNNQKLTKMSRCLVVCPLNTVLNWVHEFEIWLEDVDFQIEVYEMSKVKGNFQRADMLKEWHESSSAVMIIGYDMYRNLVMGSHCRNKKQKKIFFETLADPGPDLVVCDEGHILKNDQTTLSKSMNKIKTRRRIVLTGTPLQNNLGEYHCMVSFVKPSLLGTRKEFNNRFANPITNGQCSDSTPADVKVMKRRAHILHELLAGCVQRKDYSALTKYLPPKFEYVVSVRLSKVQMTLYEKYLEISGLGDGGIPEIQSKGAQLFRDYQALMRIWTHPWVLKLDEIRQENKRRYSDDEDSFIDDTDSEGEDSMLSGSTSSSSSGSEKDQKYGKKNEGKKNSSDDDDDDKNDKGEEEVVKKWTSRRRGNDQGAGSSWMEDIDMGYGQEQGPKEVTSEWWAEYVKEDDANRLELSGKLSLLFEILKMCEDIGDKVLLFSQSLLSLDIIEEFLQKIDEANNGTAVNTTADKSCAGDDKTGAGDDKTGAGDDKTSAGDDKTGAAGDSKTGAGDGETDIVKVNGDISKDNENASGSGEATGEKDDVQKAKEQLSQYGKSWTKGADYFRMDGSTNSQNRKASQDMFNNPENFRARLFLISTKAGSLGINLVAANRVVIFDASWNPSHDIQSIFRVYRFGQVKPVYVYRFLAQGTMEEKIYERQVTKQSLSQRVVDEHQIERHFTASDLQELYKFQPDRLDDPNRKERLPMLPKDHMLAELMTQNKEWIVTFHEHDSLLENVVSQELTEEEKKAAWEDYENEKKGITKVMYGGAMNSQFMGDQQMNMHNLLMMGQASLGQQAVLQIVQDLKVRFPNLPPDIFQQRVQAVLKQVLTQQIMQQTEMQRRQHDLQKLNELNRLNQIKQQIQRQQAMLSGQQHQYGIRLGSLMGGVNQYGGAGGQYFQQMLNVRPPLRQMMPKQGDAMNLMTRPQGSLVDMNPPIKPPVVPMPAISKPGSQK